MRVALTPTTLPRRYLSHRSQCPILHILPIESAAEVQARAKREANVKENNNDLKVLDQAPAKAAIGSLSKVEIFNARCGVGRNSPHTTPCVASAEYVNNIVTKSIDASELLNRGVLLVPL